MKRSCALLALATLLAGCSELFPEDKMTVELLNFTNENGRPAVRLQATNSGDLDIYNAACDALAMRGTTVVDSAFLYFANGAVISPGQSAIDTGVFIGLSSLGDFQTVNYQCDYLVSD